MLKKIKNIYVVRVYSILFVLLGSLLLYSCDQINDSSDSTDKDIKFYVDSVEKNEVVKNSVILEATKFSDKSDIPEVNWVNKLGSPSQWLILMYKRGSSNIFFSSIVAGENTTKQSGKADYVNTSKFTANENFPVEYRVSVIRIEKGTWKIDSSTGQITVSGTFIKEPITLDSQAQIDISRHGEKEYTIRIEGKDALKHIETNAKKIIDGSFSGQTAGIPLIKFPSNFVLRSTSLENGEFISEIPEEKGFKHSAGNCSGYAGNSVSPALDWSTRTENSRDSIFVVLAYDPVQKNPVRGIFDLNKTVAAPYYAFWFQYNIPFDTKQILEGNAGNGKDDKEDEDNPLFENKLTPSAGKLAHNVYSRSSNSLLGLYILPECYDKSKISYKKNKKIPLPVRQRYDGPVPNPYSGRHYIRFIVFELKQGPIEMFKDSSVKSIEFNIKKSQEKRAELKKFSFDHEYEVSGSAVDELVQNFIDLDRTKIRNNNFSNLEIKHKNGTAKVLGVSILIFAMKAPLVPF